MIDRVVYVEGGMVVRTDLMNIHERLFFPKFHCAIADPAYGGDIVTDAWNKISTDKLVGGLVKLMERASQAIVPGGHFWVWGGIGTPRERPLYRLLVEVELSSKWEMAEHITWRKKRGYGTAWRCLMNREECLRFVYGDVRRPHYYERQVTDELRGYAGFNKKYPARSPYKRLTMIWDHASDMGQNKPHKCHKPAPLAESQILATTRKGDTVLDFFAGSGEVSLKARELERQFVAYEGDPKQFERLVDRLKS